MTSEDRGFRFVDRCIKVELARFDGGLAIGGLNSRLIAARRRIT